MDNQQEVCLEKNVPHRHAMDETLNSLALFPASAMKVRLFRVLNDYKMNYEKDKKKKDKANLFHPPMTCTK